MSAFINARFDKIDALQPDLILAFSDLQADIAAELIRRGYHGRDVQSAKRRRNPADDQDARRRSSGAPTQPTRSRDVSTRRSTPSARVPRRCPRRPRVFFEEWDDPLISGIRWVDELIEIAGGDTVLSRAARRALAKNRIVRPEAVRGRGSRRHHRVMVREGNEQADDRRAAGLGRVSAVRNDHVYEIKSTYILQPGPASLTEGVAQLHEHIARAFVDVDPDAPIQPEERGGFEPTRISARWTAAAACPPLGLRRTALGLGPWAFRLERLAGADRRSLGALRL